VLRCLLQVPPNGTVTFTLLPAGITLGVVPVQQDITLGSATAYLEEPAPSSPSYGEYTGARAALASPPHAGHYSCMRLMQTLHAPP
jgi:hypothetical protein